MMKPTKKEQLDLILQDGYKEDPSIHYEVEAKFIPNKGWYAISYLPRFPNDCGTFLGATFEESIVAAKKFY